MGFFISLVLALVIAWLICQLIRKTWKPFLRSMPKICKVMIWIIVILIILAVVVIIVLYVGNYVKEKELLAEMHMLPSDIVSEIREKGIKKWWWRVSANGASYKEQEGLVNERVLAGVKRKALIEAKEREFTERTGLPPTNIFQDVFYDLWFRLRYPDVSNTD